MVDDSKPVDGINESLSILNVELTNDIETFLLDTPPLIKTTKTAIERF